MTNWVVISWILDMWRRPPSIGRGIQTCPNYRIYMRESAHKSNSEFNSSPIQNPGEVDLKSDAQVAYNIQSGNSWSCWKYKEIIFPIDRSHIQLKSESTGIYETSRVSKTCRGVVTPYFGLWPVYHVRAQ
jgi:hypothetical protein